MIVFVLGFQKSGKSLYVEQSLMGKQVNVVYIGTLPTIFPYFNTIKKHKIRRPDEWKLIELSYVINDDFRKINESILEFEYQLLDGLSLYLIRQVSIFPTKQLYLIKLIKSLLSKAKKTKGIFYFVDHPISINLPIKQKKFLLEVHMLIAHASQQVIFYKDSVPTIISQSELINLDKNGVL